MDTKRALERIDEFATLCEASVDLQGPRQLRRRHRPSRVLGRND